MNEFYMSNWEKLRHIEGASQRVQEDTMRFSSTLEGLGISLDQLGHDAVVFLPILSSCRTMSPSCRLIGQVPHSLVLAGALLVDLRHGVAGFVGIKLPGLNFRNQRVEAAYRKELVYGEDHADRASRRRSPSCSPMFAATISACISTTCISTSPAISTCRPTICL
jgi:peptide/bleomycin uptake transporter